MRSILLEYPIETASAVAMLLGGLWMKFGVSREDLWGYMERWARSNRLAARRRKEVWAEGIEPVRGVGCIAHIETADRRRG